MSYTISHCNSSLCSSLVGRSPSPHSRDSRCTFLSKKKKRNATYFLCHNIRYLLVFDV
jgi:hypothetical protein